VRIKWDTTLQVNINDDGNTAEIEGFIVVDNQTGFSYENVELGFAIFELPRTTTTNGEAYPPPPPLMANEMPEMQQEMLGDLNRLKSMKRTQRFKQLL